MHAVLMDTELARDRLAESRSLGEKCGSQPNVSQRGLTGLA